MRETSEFLMSPLSIQSSSSSTVTFSEELLFCGFFENKTRKNKTIQYLQTDSPRFYFIHVCFFSSVENVGTKVNQIR